MTILVLRYIGREMSKISLSLGSNIGNRVKNLNRAISMLGDRGLYGIKVSSFYETEPQGYREQDYFVNCALIAETDLDPQELLKVTQGVERDMKRVKLFRWGPRIIDVDILTYEDVELESEMLTIPHPRMLERSFVLTPLTELLPEYKIHLSNVSDQKVVKIPEST